MAAPKFKMHAQLIMSSSASFRNCTAASIELPNARVFVCVVEARAGCPQLAREEQRERMSTGEVGRHGRCPSGTGPLGGVLDSRLDLFLHSRPAVCFP